MGSLVSFFLYFLRITREHLHAYEVRPRKDKRGFDLISDALRFGQLWYDRSDAVANAIGYAEHRRRAERNHH